jgi:hypothetical protein
MGMVHVAMFEAINGIANEFNPYYMGVVKPTVVTLSHKLGSV